MTTDLLHLMTMTIKFYIESGITRLEINIHNIVLVNFSHSLLHSYNDAFSYLTLYKIHPQTMHQFFNVFLE